METSITNISCFEKLYCSDQDESLFSFTNAVLNCDSTHENSGESAILSSPEKDLWQTKSCSNDQVEDQFEGIFYNTYITDCMTKLRFISSAFFTCFCSKLKADFGIDINRAETSPASTNYTHIQGLKCEMTIDIDSKSVKVSGVGHRLWHKEYFPKMAFSLFKRYVQEADSQLCGEEFRNGVLEEEKEEPRSQYFGQIQPETAALSTTDLPIFTSTPIVQRLDPRSDQSSTQNSTYSECLLSIVNTIAKMETELKELKQNVVFSMEKKIDELKTSLLVMFEQYAKKEKSFTAVLLGSSQGNNSRTTDEGFCNSTANSVVPDSSQTHQKTIFQAENEKDSWKSHSANYVNQTKNMQPEMRDKPIQQSEARYNTLQQSETRDNPSRRSETRDNTLQQPETRDNPLRQSETRDNPLRQSETRDNPLRQSETRDNTLRQPETRDNPFQHHEMRDNTFRQSETPESPLRQHKVRDNSHRQPEAQDNHLRLPKARDKPLRHHETQDDRLQQQVPVRITNRVPVRPTQPSNGSYNKNKYQRTTQNIRSDTRQHQAEKTLLIGSSILHPINTKGLIRGTHKHARSGATISDITNDIGMYDLTAFQNIIISVGGNDSARKTEEELFEEKYDQLISLIKTSSPESTIYICKIAPRGDTDVSSVNTCIERLSLHWQKHNVICISNTRDYFYSKNGIPTERYFSSDGIHLSRSGVKRLLDAINSSIEIVENYELCVFSRPANQRNAIDWKRNTLPNQGQRYLQHSERQARTPRSGAHYTERRHVNKRCYACRMMGHISSECWN